MEGLKALQRMQALMVVVIFNQIAAAGNNVALAIAVITHGPADKGFGALPITVLLNRAAIITAGIAGVVVTGATVIVTGVTAGVTAIVSIATVAAITPFAAVPAIITIAAMAATTAAVTSIATVAIADIDGITRAIAV
jgi:hypothetical protein